MSTRNHWRGSPLGVPALLFSSSLLLAAPAFAQQNVPVITPPIGGDLPNTTVPAPAPGRSGYWLPGQPLPVGGQGSVNGVNDTGALKPDPHAGVGRGEAVVRPEDLASAGVRMDDFRGNDGSSAGDGNLPETHLVKKGDTLWDLSSTYFRNPYYWPKLWAANPVITNPHWIYPGDVIRLRAGEVAQPVAATQPVSSNRLIRITREGAIEGGIHLRATGFVESGELKTAGRIAGSRSEKMMLTYLDETYVEWKGDGKSKKPHPGERLSIYQVQSEVRRPGSKQVIGSLVEIVGELEIRSVGDNHIARAVIVEARDPIERGFLVGPLKRRFDLAAIVPDQANVDADVLTTLTPSELMGEGMLIFLDRGHDDGLVPGNRMMVVRRGDGYQKQMNVLASDDPRFPREIFGEILILDVREKTATGVVLRSTKEVEIGDHLEARKGY